MALKLHDKKEEAVKETATVKAEEKAAATAASAPVENIEAGVLGSKSHTIEFVAALGDPSRDDITPGKNGEDKRVDPVIVGYRFRALEDVVVPDCGTTPNLKTDLMDFDSEKVDNTRVVKKGETFDLTRFETGLLLAPPEFNGKVTGGQKPVICVYQTSATKSANGEVTKKTDMGKMPGVSLRAVEGSIKDYQIIPVLEFTKEPGAGKGMVVKKRTIIPGFEKWEPLCRVATRTAGAKGAASAAGNQRNQRAAAFLNIVNQKKKNAAKA